jgi:phosphatidylinositol-3-phosphatase
MTSGSTQGITRSDDPGSNVQITGDENLGEQLEDAGIPWRAYMDAMGEPCRMSSADPYGANHNPFVYYRSLTSDRERCEERVVDFEEHFQADLDSDAYRFMWITPDRCNDMHDCPSAIGDAWLARVLAQITASPGYQRGGVVFILFDEGYLRLGRAGANLATLIVSPRLVRPAYVTNTRFDHRSYLATIEDIFGMPRLPSTVGATPMGEFFVSREEAP